MNETIRLVDAPELMEVLERLVAQAGASTRRWAVYVRQGEPWCLAGCAFHALGVSLRSLEAMEGELAATLVHTPRDGVRLTPAAGDLIGAVQAMQDSYSPWGVALDAVKGPFR